MARIFIDTAELDRLSSSFSAQTEAFSSARTAIVSTAAATAAGRQAGLVSRAMGLANEIDRLGGGLQQASIQVRRQSMMALIRQMQGGVASLMAAAPSVLWKYTWPGFPGVNDPRRFVNSALLPGLIRPTPITAPSVFHLGGGPSPFGQFVGVPGLMANSTAQVLNNINSAMQGPLSPVAGLNSWVGNLLAKAEARTAAGMQPSQLRLSSLAGFDGTGYTLGQINANNAIFTKIGAGTSVVRGLNPFTL